MINLKEKIKKRLTNFIINAIFNVDDYTKAQLFYNLKKSQTLNRQKQFREKYSIDESFRFNGEDILFYGNGRIICGKYSYIGDYSTVQAHDDCQVEIGNNCSISHNVRIYTTTNIADQDLNNTEPKQKKHKDVIIKNGVWIGANVFINPGVVIGENAIVGANSVVTKSIEPNAIYGGVPAKLIKYKNY